ncbi:MAG TPA: glycerophosphodiester phosphodiesterase [Dongiaceae bacterium]|jgi:glycerophosphoryl diester phosphodiesterase|nr:glycerophosphodiester phosphodiesterase [Dongiaceae bacterium]
MRFGPLIAHRGASAHAPENTIAAFRAAAASGVGWIECDATITRDRAVVLFHDDTLERTSDGMGLLVEKNWSDVSALDAGSWFSSAFRGERIPLLREAVDVWGQLGLRANIEIKVAPGLDAETARCVMAELAAHWPGDREPPLISSFSREALGVARDMQRAMPRGLLLEDHPGDWRDLARSLEVVSIHCWEETLTEEWARAIKDDGYGLAVYTLNDAAKAREMFRRGADAIFTDRPEEMAASFPQTRI